MSVRITIANNKGGVAKTTTVVNLGAALAAHFRVLIVDADPQGNATMQLGRRDAPSSAGCHLAAAIDGPVEMASVIRPTSIPGLSLLASHSTLREVPMKYAGYKTQYELFRHSLGTPADDKLKEYDVVLFDTSPALNALLASALDVSHHYLIPVFAEIEPIMGLVELRDWLSKTAATAAGKVSLLGILIANHDKNNATHRQMASFLTAHAGDARILQSVIPTSAAVKAAALAGTSVITFRNGTSPAAMAYGQCAAELVELMKAERTWPTNRQGER